MPSSTRKTYGNAKFAIALTKLNAAFFLSDFCAISLEIYTIVVKKDRTGYLAVVGTDHV